MSFNQDSFAANSFPDKPLAPVLETYHYRATPTDSDGDSDREAVTMEYNKVSDEARCSSLSVSSEYTEHVAIIMKPEGSIIAATRKKILHSSGVVSESRVWEDGQIVNVEKIVGTKMEKKSRPIPKGQKVAVDMSLLYLLRSFPFGKSEQWHVFMADFSGQFITVSIRDQGVERVIVPAGTFDCYRVEVTVSFLFLKAKIVYWMTTSPPHFLVKHEGKRGPFTKSYTTVLVSEEAATTGPAAWFFAEE